MMDTVGTSGISAKLVPLVLSNFKPYANLHPLVLNLLMVFVSAD